jgi:hypothetical protein
MRAQEYHALYTLFMRAQETGTNLDFDTSNKVIGCKRVIVPDIEIHSFVFFYWDVKVVVSGILSVVCIRRYLNACMCMCTYVRACVEFERNFMTCRETA